ncbi:hypothetical protein LVY72_01140 [Arthrobacter sp. I2-34]|uniref:Uncharacterized protein n=1 Tax=Arthrobacter hankyongi TaxID=2904801 RepID=A0ABS9L1X7_9MICC|nr:hypothetical protein [Arthrobacter hankyongi]MCG2620512.1 hypothetical protein [Arthrobacter hankyongi]
MTASGTFFEYPVAGELAVSFQRYPYPETGRLNALPTSLGALPVCSTAPGRILLPCPAGEAFWIGFLPAAGAAPAAVGLLAVTGSGDGIDAVSGRAAAPGAPDTWFQVPPRRQLEGIHRPDGGWWALARTAAAEAPACSRLQLCIRRPAAPLVLEIVLTDEREFEASCGTPVPEPGPGYGGWRLP